MSEILLFGLTCCEILQDVSTEQGLSISQTQVYFSCRDVVEVLLRNDALTNVADCKGCYPLHLAAWKGDADIVKLLIHQGPSHTKVNEQVCIFFCIIPLNRSLGWRDTSSADCWPFPNQEQ